MQSKKYQVINEFDSAMSTPCDLAWQAVLEAAEYDGFAALFQRDEDGVMRFYSSSRHIGNNPYKPTAREAGVQESLLIDDDLARDELALKIIASRNPVHSRYANRVQVLIFEDGVLQYVDGEPVYDILKYRRYNIGDDEGEEGESDSSIMRDLVGYGIPFNAENPKDCAHSNPKTPGL